MEIKMSTFEIQDVRFDGTNQEIKPRFQEPFDRIIQRFYGNRSLEYSNLKIHRSIIKWKDLSETLGWALSWFCDFLVGISSTLFTLVSIM